MEAVVVPFLERLVFQAEELVELLFEVLLDEEVEALLVEEVEFVVVEVFVDEEADFFFFAVHATEG